MSTKEEDVKNGGTTAPSHGNTRPGSGWAPVKPEFLLSTDNVDVKQSEAPKSSAPTAEPSAPTAEPSAPTAEPSAPTAEPSAKRQKIYGQNKTRRTQMHKQEAQIKAMAFGETLCASVANPEIKCKAGGPPNCRFQHDLAEFMKVKPPDLGPVCPVWRARGKCSYGWTCRFMSDHAVVDDSSPIGWRQLEPREPETPYKATLNGGGIGISTAMRRKEINFTRSHQAIAAAQKPLVKDESTGAMAPEYKSKLDVKSLRSQLYLAPLTTVGNLPFRRLCVDSGADITCGEMALATALLQGNLSEWSLVKRHPSEKIFGVQLAGGYPDTMTMAAQIITDRMQVDFIDVNMGCPIDLINEKGGGCALASNHRRMTSVFRAMRSVMGDVVLTGKLRTGVKNDILTAHDTIAKLRELGPQFGPSLITLHPRSKEQRYSRLPRWDFVPKCAEAAGEIPLWVCGDVLSYEDYYERLDATPTGGVMIGRGALIKPWLFTEIKERRYWDIRSSERLDLMKKFASYGLDHWGSDSAGIQRTRRFLLEWLSFTCRYIPVGLLERLPQRVNERPPPYRGRDDLETLMGSQRSDDWVRLAELVLGPTPEGFTFVPKHKASSYAAEVVVNYPVVEDVKPIIQQAV